MRAPVFVLVGAAAWSGRSAANPWAKLPRREVAEHAIPALETCLRNCRLAEENRVIAPSIDKLGNNLEYFGDQHRAEQQNRKPRIVGKKPPVSTRHQIFHLLLNFRDRNRSEISFAQFLI